MMSRFKLVVFFILSQFYLSFSQISFDIESSLGCSYLRTTHIFDGFVPNEIDQTTTIYSRPSFSAQVIGSITYSFPKMIDFTYGLGLRTRGYNYRVFDYLEEPFIQVNYRKYEIVSKVSANYYLFEGINIKNPQKRKKKVRTRDIDNSSNSSVGQLPFLYTGLTYSYRIGDRYRYNGIDESNLLEAERLSAAIGYELGFGIKFNEKSFAVIYSGDFTDFIEIDLHDQNPQFREWSLRVVWPIKYK